MLRLMADNDVLGHVSRLAYLCQTPEWIEFWRDLGCVLYTFGDFGLSPDAKDAKIWEVCQANDVILITGNRSGKDPDSLDATIRQANQASCIPVMTISDARRISRDRDYANAVIERLFEFLLEIENLRGTGRLFLP
jgi:hypothetical protein